MNIHGIAQILCVPIQPPSLLPPMLQIEPKQPNNAEGANQLTLGPFLSRSPSPSLYLPYAQLNDTARDLYTVMFPSWAIQQHYFTLTS